MLADPFVSQHDAVSYMKLAKEAAYAVPPSFPLDATVAVNPFLGQTNRSLSSTAQLLERVAGVRVIKNRSAIAHQLSQGEIIDEDLAGALAACPSKDKPRNLSLLKGFLTVEHALNGPFPSVADLASKATSNDWRAIISRSFGLWAAGYFDRGQALWQANHLKGAYAAWKAWAEHDLTPEIAGMSNFCAHVFGAPGDATLALERASARLGITEAAAATVYHRLLLELGGWAQHARWMGFQAELRGEADQTVVDLLAIRLVWEEALIEQWPRLEEDWRRVVSRHQQPLEGSTAHVVDSIFQEAAERAYQRTLSAQLKGDKPTNDKPLIQAAFCIDVRSEVFRRALERSSARIETIGFAGFFGLPVAHRPQGTDEIETHLPVLLRPALHSDEHRDATAEQALRVDARTKRAWGRFRQAAVSSFAFVESAGPAYALKLVKDAFGIGGRHNHNAGAPEFSVVMGATQKAELAATILGAMGLKRDFAPIVLLVGHGAQSANNPQLSAYHCGACGGHSGEVSARLLARLLNDPETREGLGPRGIDVPPGTCFVGALHNTTTDEVALFDDDGPSVAADTLSQLRTWLRQAGKTARAERATRLPGAATASIARRAVNWAEVRPEWGLAGCASFIAAPRSATRQTDLKGRAFLHSYDWRQDDGFRILELILTAPVVVASWISLQYYGSVVAPELFGSGNKLIQNVVGGIGTVIGNGGVMRAGLPWQAVHDGQGFVHEALRLSVLIEAPRPAIDDVLSRHAVVRALFDNRWLHLFSLEDGQVSHRYAGIGDWGVEREPA